MQTAGLFFAPLCKATQTGAAPYAALFMGRDKPKPGELTPINWAGVEREYRAGIAPLRAIATKFGCSHGAITKHAKKERWTRDLNPKIHARAAELVSKAALSSVSKPASMESKMAEAITVESNALALSIVQLGHRADIAALRAIIKGLMGELAVVVEQPELYGLVHDALANPDEPAIDALRDMAALVVSLPGRTKVAKDLADALHRAIGMEREAFGLDTAAGTDGRPMVIIRDYTGRGDADSPVEASS